ALLSPLHQFRQLARSHGSADGSPESYRAMYALLDEEVVESLGAGGPHAAPAFLADRLDAVGEAGGATTVDVLRVGRFVVGAFQISDVPGANTVRVYGKLGGEAALLTTLSREGRPTVYPWASGPGGAAQFVTAWEGPSTGQGLRPLRLDLIRQEGDGVRVVWSTTDLFPDGLSARACLGRGAEIRLRYELRYPGWSPGCEGQTESEDLFRASPETGSLVRKSGRPLHGWHRRLPPPGPVPPPARNGPRSPGGPAAPSTAGPASCARRSPSSSRRSPRRTRRAWPGWGPTTSSAGGWRPRAAARPRATHQ